MSPKRLITLITITAPLMLLVGCESDGSNYRPEETPKDRFSKTTKPIAKTSTLKPKCGSSTIRPLSVDDPVEIIDDQEFSDEEQNVTNNN